jgi:hypothetical protein
MKTTRKIGSRTLAVGLAAMAVAAFAPPVGASGPPAGFVGQWRSIDCATGEDGTLHCEIWGDASVQYMSIGPGATPPATFIDTYATVCANSGSPSTRWVAAGSGEYEDIFLWLTFTKSGCGRFGMGGYGGVQLYHDPGSDTIWQGTDDGYGYMWHRVP